MAECINDLAGDILQDCNTVYGVGVEKIAYLIKKSDLDESATTYTKPKITKIALKSGKRAYRFSIPSKTPYNGLIYEDQNARNRHRHQQDAAAAYAGRQPRELAEH